jgi:hypothetical protein
VCVGSNPVVCQALDQCHEVGVCDPTTGACSQPAKPDGSPCDDGDLCTQSDTCQSGICVGSDPVVCIALDECHEAGVCDPGTGLCGSPPKPNGTPCSDANACTDTDTCQEGVCTPGTEVVCAPPGACQQDGICNPNTGQCEYLDAPDGTPCDDGDLCTIGDTCLSGVCVSGAQFNCPPADQCHELGVCNPLTGTCEYVAKPDGSICDDGDACTQTDTCQAGQCVGADPVVCAPGGQCEDLGVCNPATGLCEYGDLPDGTACDDGDACTQSDTCQSGVCVGGSPVVCVAQDECHEAGICDPLTGQCSNPAKPNGVTCGDGNACTKGDTCQEGVCVPGTAVFCPPADACHEAGICNPATGLCEYASVADGTVCGTFDPCKEDDICQAGVCVPGAPLTCPPLGDCYEAGICDPNTGVCLYDVKADGTLCGAESDCAHDICVQGDCLRDQAKPDGTPCDDGDACTQSDTCQAGLCVGADPVICQALDACHDVGICDPLTGQCTQPAKPNGTPCSDDNACTDTDTCQEGVCTPGIEVVCASPGPCQQAGICNPNTGQCEYDDLLDGSPCDDGNPCTLNDTCQGGLCVSGTPHVCQPMGQCYEEGVCNPVSAQCEYALKADGTPCDDGNLCTRIDTCQQGQCIGGDPVICTASDECHEAGICNPGTGICSDPALPDGTPCDDGDACTQTDTCQAGVCTGADSVVCVALDACHEAGVCDPVTGQCTNPPKPNGSPCSDDSACTDTDTCQDGVCLPGTEVVCTAPGPCQEEGICNPATGQCEYADKSDGTPCDAGDLCSTDDFCQAGVCTPGTPVTCPPFGDCYMEGVCDSIAGCVYDIAPDGTLCGQDGACTHDVCFQGTCLQNDPKPNGTPCDDGDLCTVDDFCEFGACVPGDPVVCDDGDPCTDDTCDPATGVCIFTPSPGTACIPLDPCHTDGICQADGTCLGTPIVCNNGDACSEGACNPQTGECVFTAIQCPSDGPCLVGECVSNLGCIQTRKHCDDGNECTDSFCEAVTGICQHYQVLDGRPCNADAGMCQAGECRAILGESCTTVEDCYQGGPVPALCEQTPNGQACCRPVGSECIADSYCCSGQCIDYACAP